MHKRVSAARVRNIRCKRGLPERSTIVAWNSRSISTTSGPAAVDRRPQTIQNRLDRDRGHSGSERRATSTAAAFSTAPRASIDVARVVVVHLDDKDTAVAFATHEALLNEPLKRFSHGTATNLQLPGRAPLRQADGAAETSRRES